MTRPIRLTAGCALLAVLAAAGAACSTSRLSTGGDAPPRAIVARADRGLDVIASQESPNAAGDITSAYLYLKLAGNHPIQHVMTTMQANGWSMTPVSNSDATGNYGGYYATVQTFASFRGQITRSPNMLDTPIVSGAAKATVVVTISGP